MTDQLHSLLIRVESIEKRLMKNDEDHKEFYNRIRITEMHEAIQDQRYNTITEKLDMAIKAVRVTRAVITIRGVSSSSNRVIRVIRNS